MIIDSYRVPSGIVTSPLVTAQTLGSPRGGYSGTVGWGMTVASATTIYALGRWVLSGNNKSHTLYLYDGTAASLIDSVALNTSGLSVGFNYVNLGTPRALTVGNFVCFLSSEVSGLDQFTDFGPITVAAVGSNVGTVVANTPPSGTFTNPGGANQGYGLTNALYA